MTQISLSPLIMFMLGILSGWRSLTSISSTGNTGRPFTSRFSLVTIDYLVHMCSKSTYTNDTWAVVDKYPPHCSEEITLKPITWLLSEFSSTKCTEGTCLAGHHLLASIFFLGHLSPSVTFLGSAHQLTAHSYVLPLAYTTDRNGTEQSPSYSA